MPEWWAVAGLGLLTGVLGVVGLAREPVRSSPLPDTETERERGRVRWAVGLAHWTTLLTLVWLIPALGLAYGWLIQLGWQSVPRGVYFVPLGLERASGFLAGFLQSLSLCWPVTKLELLLIFGTQSYRRYAASVSAAMNGGREGPGWVSLAVCHVFFTAVAMFFLVVASLAYVRFDESTFLVMTPAGESEYPYSRVQAVVVARRSGSENHSDRIEPQWGIVFGGGREYTWPYGTTSDQVRRSEEIAAFIARKAGLQVQRTELLKDASLRRDGAANGNRVP